MNEHRVPMLGAALRRHVDPTRSTDPKVRELVSALAGLDVAPAPRPDFRAELRAQLVAVAPRLVSEGETGLLAAAAPAERAPKRARKPAGERGFRLAKPLIAAACVLTAFALLVGGAVLLSRRALPGDALYGIKRASENTEYSLAGSSADKGKLKLEFAAHRIGEVAALLPASGEPNADAASLLNDTLQSADGDIRAASQLLGTSAVRTGNPRPLTSITSWVPGQIKTMQGVVARLPAGALRSQAAATLLLLTQLRQRAEALRADLGCGCLNTTTSDLLGPLPCAGPCGGSSAPLPAGGHATAPRNATRAPGTHSAGTDPISAPAAPAAPSAPTLPTAPSGGRTATGGARRTVTAAPARRAPTIPAVVVPTGPAATTPAGGALPMPALPTVPGLIGGATGGKTGGVPSVPISVGSCGLSASVGPIQIGIGGC